MKDLLTLRLVRARRSHHEQKCRRGRRSGVRRSRRGQPRVRVLSRSRRCAGMRPALPPAAPSGASRACPSEIVKARGFLRLGKPLSKGQRTLSKSASLLHTRPVLNASPVSSILDVRSFLSFDHLHTALPYSIRRISIPNPFDSPCTATGLLTRASSFRHPFHDSPPYS